MKKLWLLLLPVLLFIAEVKAQDKWLIRSNKNLDFIVELTIQNGKIEAATRKNALIDYIGAQKYNFVKTMYPVKYPEIVHFEAQVNAVSGIFTGTYNQLYTQYHIEGSLTAGRIAFSAFDKSNTLVDAFKGEKLDPAFITSNFLPDAEKIIQTVEENLYDPALLESGAWLNYREKLLSNAGKIQDDLELQAATLALGLELPFSHLALLKKQTGSIDIPFSLADLNAFTGLLKISSFTGNKKKMDDMISRILSKGYTTLIIDLRNNPGGNNETALPLGNFLTGDPFISGFFPNKKWYTQFKRQPAKEDEQKFSSFTGGSMQDFYKKAITGYGCYIKNIPSEKHFKGKIYVLVNEGTASTAEAFALALKENKIATVIGTKTAGQLLSAKRFRINNNLELLVPLNDYVSYAGYRVDKKGIVPDIIIKTDPLDYIKSLNVQEAKP